MKTILSVDYDYFLPRPAAEFDWSHTETGGAIYYEMVWQLRTNSQSWVDGASAVDCLQVDKAELASFWDRTLGDYSLASIGLCDSHSKIVDFIEANRWLLMGDGAGVGGGLHIIFDQHHDWRYSPKVKEMDWTCSKHSR